MCCNINIKYHEHRDGVALSAVRQCHLTCAIPSSQPLMTSCRPILNLKGLFLSREESNFFPFCSIPGREITRTLNSMIFLGSGRCLKVLVYACILLYMSTTVFTSVLVESFEHKTRPTQLYFPHRSIPFQSFKNFSPQNKLKQNRALFCMRSGNPSPLLQEILSSMPRNHSIPNSNIKGFGKGGF